jgi:hypothetical protein
MKNFIPFKNDLNKRGDVHAKTMKNLDRFLLVIIILMGGILVIIGGKIVIPPEPICIQCGFGLDFYSAVILTACGIVLFTRNINVQNNKSFK